MESRLVLGVEGIAAGTSGTVYFDAFESRRVSHIGPLAYAAPGIALAAANGSVQPVSYHAKVVLPSLSLQQSTAVTIDYVYDPPKRLTQANYSNGDYYHHAYDAVGNRLSQESTVNGQPFTNTTTNTLTGTCARTRVEHS